MAKILQFPAPGGAEEGFTPEARRRWNEIPPDVRDLLLHNAYCRACKAQTAISNPGGEVREGLLVLHGECARCRGPVTRAVD
ncbi:MAG: hypothetical protein GF418_01795 [Chitinivibrionales bacterium]|nr:hypothetical protein [Chitinivibrionales bacterium]MBD3394332.1 hypothetical protein [Chitinivibrionales bacterium]